MSDITEAIAALALPESDRTIMSTLFEDEFCLTPFFHPHGQPDNDAVKAIAVKTGLDDWYIYYCLKYLKIIGLVNSEGPIDGAILEYASTGKLSRGGGIYCLREVLFDLDAAPIDLASIRTIPTPGTILRDALAGAYAASFYPSADPQTLAAMVEAKLRKFIAQPLDEQPEPLGENALQGVVGDFVRAALPFTEADESCLAYQFLIAVGNAIGRKVYGKFGADHHYPNLFLLTIGGTGTGKGQALNHVKELMRVADPEWAKNKCKYSAASGEAIVRLASEAGPDGRLLLMLSEISILWNSMNREGANTSGYLRSAYDGMPLENNRAKSQVVASDYVMSVISHCTPEELAGLVSNTNWYDGLINRFVFAQVAKSKTLPRMNRTPDYSALGKKLQDLLALPYEGPVEFSEGGGKAWDTWVMSLPDLDGRAGAAMQRIRPNALRLALIYATLDESRLVFTKQPFRIEERHVRAAVEVVERSMASVRWFLNRPVTATDAPYDKIAKVRNAANKRGGRLTGTELAAVLSHDSEEVRKTIARQAGLKLQTVEPGEKGGRKQELWQF